LGGESGRLDSAHRLTSGVAPSLIDDDSGSINRARREQANCSVM